MLQQFCNTSMNRMFSVYTQNIINKSVFKTELLAGEHKGIFSLGINRAERKNAISKAFVQEMDDILDEIESNTQVHVVVLHSVVPQIFCAGADLKEREEMKISDVVPFVRKLRKLTLKLQQLTPVTIAAMDGHALGGGLELAMSCDLLICASDIRLGLVETSLGIFPGAGGCARMSRLIGSLKAKELVLTAEVFNGEKAEKLGLVNRAVSQNSEGNAAFQAALSLAKKITANALMATKLAKFVLNHGYDIDLKTALALEEAAYSSTVFSKDRSEALKAFKEKRPPIFTGE